MGNVKQLESDKATRPQMKVGSFGSPSKKVFIIGSGALVVIALTIFGYLYFLRASGNDVSLKALTVCSDETIKTASDAIEASDSAALGKVAAKVASLEDYTNDVNCLYIAARYNIMIANTSKARTYIDLLKKKSPEVSSYSRHFAKRPMTTETMEKVLATLAKQAEEIEALQEDNDSLDAAAMEYIQ